MSLGQLFSRYVVAGALALAAADALAVVMTVTVNSTTSSPIAAPLNTDWSTPGDAPRLEIAQFDNTLGTLTAVEFAFTSNGEFEFEIISPEAGDPGLSPATGSYKQTLKLNLTGLGLAAAGLDNEQFLESTLSGNGGQELFTLAPSNTVTIASNTLSGFTGAGTLLFDVTATGISDNNVVGTEQVDYVILEDIIKGQASMSITYSYETRTNGGTVPAPGALVLIGIGLVAMGLARRKEAKLL